MRPLILTIFHFFSFYCVYSQTTFSNTGDWDTAGNWSGSNPGDDVNESVDISNNKTATIRNGFSYTIGNLSFGNSSGVTINSGGTLNVGDAVNSRSLTANNSATISVAGTMIIWGDLIVNNSLVWNITGMVIIKGNVVMNNGASLSVSGTLSIDGNFTGNNNTNVTITGGGGMDVGGTVTLQNNSNLTGPAGSFTVGGGCTEGSGSSFCSSSTLPVRMLYFYSELIGDQVVLHWATDKEENFDHFEIQRSVTNNLGFNSLSEKAGARYDTHSLKEYSFTDTNPQLGVNYYRIKAVDLDGFVEFFNVISVTFNGNQKFEVYPNPATGERINLVTNFSPGEADRIIMISGSGEIISRVPVSALHGGLTIDRPLSSGVYFLRYTSGDFSRTIRLVVP